MVYGDAIDQVMFYGRGAGKFPTASAIVADLIDAAKMKGTSISQVWEDSKDNSFIADYKEDVLPFYVRVQGVSKDKAKEVFGEVEFLTRENCPADEIAFITPEIKEKDFDEKLTQLGGKVLGKIRGLNLES